MKIPLIIKMRDGLSEREKKAASFIIEAAFFAFDVLLVRTLS